MIRVHIFRKVLVKGESSRVVVLFEKDEAAAVAAVETFKREACGETVRFEGAQFFDAAEFSADVFGAKPFREIS